MMLRQLGFALTVFLCSHSVLSHAQQGYGFEKPPAPGVHPRICFSPSELPELQQRIKNSPASVGFMKTRQAEQDLANPNSPSAGWIAILKAGGSLSQDQLDTLGDKIRDGSFAAYVLQDQQAMDATSAALLTFVQRVPVTSRLDFPRALPAVAFGYDWLYDHLSSEQRQQVRQWLVSALNADAALLSNQVYGFKPNSQQLRTYNWVGFYSGAMGYSALAIEGEPGYNPQWYLEASSSLRDFFQHGIESEGAPDEAIHYFSYGMTNGAILLDAMTRRGDSSLQHPHLQNVPLWWAYDMFPWAHGDFNALQDTRDITPGQGDIYYLLALAWPDNAVLQRVYAGYVQNGNGGAYSGMVQALWAAPPTVTGDGSGQSLPLARYFATNGLLYARTGWEANDIYLEFQDDPITADGHSHADRNSFSLAGGGRLWIADGGGWFESDIYHNLVLIDGRAEGYPVQKGDVIDYADAGWATGITGDAKNTYDWQYDQKAGTTLVRGFLSTPYNPVMKARRTAVLVRGTHPYVMIVDDIQKDSSPHQYTWAGLTPLGNSVVSIDTHRAMLAPTESGASVAIDPAVNGHKRQPLKAVVNITQAGRYRLWLLAGRDYWTAWNWGASISVDGGKANRFFAKPGDNAQVHWQMVTQNNDNNPDFVLSPGEHTIALSEPDGEDVHFAALLVAPSTFDALTSGQLSIPPAYSTTWFAKLSSIPVGWRLVPADDNPPQLLFQVLNPQNASLSAAVFPFVVSPGDRVHDYNHGPEIRISAEIRSVEPAFRVLLYPHRKNDPLPSVVSGKDNATVTWNDGTVDRWTFSTPASTTAVAVERQLPDGKTSKLQMKPQPGK